MRFTLTHATVIRSSASLSPDPGMLHVPESTGGSCCCSGLLLMDVKTSAEEAKSALCKLHWLTMSVVFVLGYWYCANINKIVHGGCEGGRHLPVLLREKLRHKRSSNLVKVGVREGKILVYFYMYFAKNVFTVLIANARIKFLILPLCGFLRVCLFLIKGMAGFLEICHDSDHVLEEKMAMPDYCSATVLTP